MTRYLHRIVWTLSFLLLSGNISAEPIIDDTVGNFYHDQTITIKGSGFGSKVPARPYLWAPFEDNSINPSPLGLITSWSGVGNMEFNANEGAAGSGCAKAMDSSGIWTLSISDLSFAWNDLGQKMYLFRKTKTNFAIDGSVNWKIWRLWAADFSLPDMYISTSNGVMAVEGIDSGGWMHSIEMGRGLTNDYNTEEIIMQSNSSLSADDGLLWFIVNGVEAGHVPYEDYSKKTLKLKSQDYQDGMTLHFPVHGVKANATFPIHYRYWADDVYLDRTWARVMICDAPRWADCRQLEPQIPSHWSETEIRAVVNVGGLSQEEKVYLYIVNEYGEVNLDGYALVIGGNLTSPAEPKGLLVVPQVN